LIFLLEIRCFLIRSAHFVILVFLIDPQIFPLYFLLVQWFDVVVQCNAIQLIFFISIVSTYHICLGC